MWKLVKIFANAGITYKLITAIATAIAMTTNIG